MLDDTALWWIKILGFGVTATGMRFTRGWRYRRLKTLLRLNHLLLGYNEELAAVCLKLGGATRPTI